MHTNHYVDDTDNTAWTSENTAGTTWTRYLKAFNGLAATQDSSGVITLQLSDLHGNIDVQALPSDTSWSSGWTPVDEYGNEGNGTARYDYLGTAQRQRDTNSGLVLMGARVYNSATGRFLQVDPVAGGCSNAYAYVTGDPVNAADISGQVTCSNQAGQFATIAFRARNVAGIYHSLTGLAGVMLIIARLWESPVGLPLYDEARNSLIGAIWYFVADNCHATYAEEPAYWNAIYWSRHPVPNAFLIIQAFTLWVKAAGEPELPVARLPGETSGPPYSVVPGGGEASGGGGGGSPAVQVSLVIRTRTAVVALDRWSAVPGGSVAECFCRLILQ